FSLGFWVQTTTSGNEALLGNRVSVGHGNFLSVRLVRGSLAVEMDQDAYGTNYVPLLSSRTINDGLFHQITVVRSGTTVALYIDGLLDGSASSTGVTSLTSTSPLIAGAEPAVGFPAFNGRIDEVTIYSGALSGQQVADLYASSAGGGG